MQFVMAPAKYKLLGIFNPVHTKHLYVTSMYRLNVRNRLHAALVGVHRPATKHIQADVTMNGIS